MLLNACDFYRYGRRSKRCTLVKETTLGVYCVRRRPIGAALLFSTVV
jgi:hypothetical protein